MIVYCFTIGYNYLVILILNTSSLNNSSHIDLSGDQQEALELCMSCEGSRCYKIDRC